MPLFPFNQLQSLSNGGSRVAVSIGLLLLLVLLMLLDLLRWVRLVMKDLLFHLGKLGGGRGQGIFMSALGNDPPPVYDWRL